MDEQMRMDLAEAIYRYTDSHDELLRDGVFPFVDELLAKAWDEGWNVAATLSFPEDHDSDQYNPYRNRQDSR